MAGPDRTSSRAVELFDALEREPWAFDFFQALRRLEGAHPDRPRIGHAQRPAEDPVRLAQEPTLAFAPSTIAALRRVGDAAPRLTVFFLGLLGPNGPMPLHITDYARTRSRTAQDPALVHFLDVFHHRILSLFYRAWAASRPTVHRDRPKSDRFAVYVGSMFGQGAPAFRGRDAAPDEAKRFYAGHYAQQTRHAEGLESIVGDFFDVLVELEPFRGAWLDIPEVSRWRLGETPETGTLGVGTTVGARTWDRHLSFRLVVGPLTLADYERFLPGGDSLRRLDALVRNYVGDELDWDVKLVLAREEVPPLKLGGPTRLGISTWLASRTPDRDPADLVLHPAGSR